MSYSYTISPTTPTSVSTTFNAAAKDANSLKSFAGGVVILTSGQTSAAACQTTGVSATPPTLTLGTGGSCRVCDWGKYEIRLNPLCLKNARCT